MTRHHHHHHRWLISQNINWNQSLTDAVVVVECEDNCIDNIFWFCCCQYHHFCRNPYQSLSITKQSTQYDVYVRCLIEFNEISMADWDYDHCKAKHKHLKTLTSGIACFYRISYRYCYVHLHSNDREQINEISFCVVVIDLWFGNQFLWLTMCVCWWLIFRQFKFKFFICILQCVQVKKCFFFICFVLIRTFWFPPLL